MTERKHDDATSGDLHRVVIRRAPATGPLPPYEVSKDVTIFDALAKSDVPVPRVLAWTEDPEVFLRPFSVTPFIEAYSVPTAVSRRQPPRPRR